MGHASELHPTDRERLEKLLSQNVNGRPIESRREARRLIAELRHREMDGDQWAARALAGLATDGALRFVAAYVKEDRSVILVNRIGDPSIIEMPSRFGQRKQRHDGSLAQGYQQTFWWDFTWDELKNLIDSLARQSDTLQSRVEGLSEVLKLQEEYPESKTPAEACALKGIDPRQFAAG